jgi:hypothetical protein
MINSCKERINSEEVRETPGGSVKTSAYWILVLKGDLFARK